MVGRLHGLDFLLHFEPLVWREPIVWPETCVRSEYMEKRRVTIMPLLGMLLLAGCVVEVGIAGSVRCLKNPAQEKEKREQ